MNKSELDVIKARVEQSKSSNWVTYMVVNGDVPALIAEVERLNRIEKIALHFMEEETKLRKALEFYADKENWEWHEINDLETVPGDALNDNGETARKALQHE